MKADFVPRSVTDGPAHLRRRVFGACAVTHSNFDKVMFAGGFDAATADYTDKIETYNLRTNSWVSEASGLNEGNEISRSIFFTFPRSVEILLIPFFYAFCFPLTVNGTLKKYVVH